MHTTKHNRSVPYLISPSTFVSSKKLRTSLLVSTALTLFLASQAMAAGASSTVTQALPQVGKVVQGSAQIIVKSPTEIDVKQTSSTAIIDWQSFNIAAGDKVVFIEPNQLAQILNRVVGSGASQILGQLQANGTVIITNPNGILFGVGSEVNVKALIATTAGITNQNFMSGNLNFNIASNSPTASVVNRGTITAQDAGLVGLVAPGVENSGVIQARLGSVQLVSGNVFTVDLYGDKLIKLAVNDQVLNQLASPDGQPLTSSVANHGLIEADGGTVIMSAQTARDVVSSVINMDGVIRARSVAKNNGEIILDGGTDGTVQVAGTLDASGMQANQTGGTIQVTGDNVMVVDGARLLASGGAGGGNINVGAAQSTATDVETGVTLNASATALGNGGTVAVLGKNTKAAGTLVTEGGALGGDGGQIETSGNMLDIDGASVSTFAPNGKSGDWLLDPYDLTIDALAAASIDNALGTSSVKLQTTASSATTAFGGTVNASGSGNITIDAPIVWSANTTLTLDAYRSVQVNADITANGNTAGLNVTTNDGGTGGNFLTGAGASVTLAGANPSLTINSQPYTLIRTASQLQNMGTTGDFALANDIDLSSIPNFTPIGFVAANNDSHPIAFTGAFDGLGHTISNLAVNDSLGNYLGLFSVIGDNTTVQNFGLTGSKSITGAAFTGVLAGENSGTINNTYSTEAVNGGAYLGGLVGSNASDGIINGSYATGSVSGVNGSYYVGGLVGYNAPNALIDNSYATGVVSGATNVGGLLGYNVGTVSNSYAAGGVSGKIIEYYIGGLVGFNIGTIDGSYAAGTVNGSNYVGGLIGLSAGAVDNSYATGSVSGNNYVGGLVGQNGTSVIPNSSINSSYATGLLSGASNVGGLVGYNETGSTVTSSYWDAATTGQTSGCSGDPTCGGGAKALGGSNPSPYAQSSYAGFDFTNTWFMVNGYTRPFLRSEYSTTITNAHQLQLVDLNLAASYTLANNIDMSELTNPSGLWNTATGFVPIGFVAAGNNSNPNQFVGTFDGLGHTVLGLTIDNTSVNNLGLFSFIGFNGEVQNLNLADGNVIGGNGAFLTGFGILAGKSSGSIANTYSDGVVNIGNDAWDIGGLVGSNNLGAIADSSAAGTISGGQEAQRVGGLVGYDGGNVSNSYATSSVTGGASSGGVGGLVGWKTSGTISNSYATGAVQGGSMVGGLVGEDAGTIANSYATGAVNGGGYLGGLVGWIYEVTTTPLEVAISNSHATGNVTGGNGSIYAGGLVGFNSNITINNSYATGSVIVGNESYYIPATIGGLVGEDDGNINNSYATGTVSGGTSLRFVGGLVGEMQNGQINNSFATGNVIVGDDAVTIGGLVGANGVGYINNSYASGSVSAGIYSSRVGGLVGWNATNLTQPALSGSIANSYATGSVIVGANSESIGGLVGSNGDSGGNIGWISNSYSTGLVEAGAASQYIGGLAGYNTGTITSSYWDTTTTHQANGCSGNPTCSDGATGLTTVEWLTQGPAATNAPGWDFTNVWLPGYPYPVLRALPYIDITANDATKTYGTANPAFSVASITDQNGDNASSLVNTSSLTWLTVPASTDVGTYNMGGSGVAAAGYQIAYNGALDITPKALTISGISVPTTKVYDDTTSVALTGIAGLLSSDAFGTGSADDGIAYSGDAVSLMGQVSAAYNSKNVATASSILLSGGSLTGAKAKDYTLVTTTVAASITPKTLTVTGLSAPDSKVYDGTTVADVSGKPKLLSTDKAGSGTSTDGKAYTGDTVAFLGMATGTYNSKNVVDADLVTFGGLTSSNSNYVLNLGAQKATITPKRLTIIANNEDVIEGNLLPPLSASYYGFVNGENASELTDQAILKTHATSNSRPGEYVIKVFGAYDPNYSIRYVNGTVTVQSPPLHHHHHRDERWARDKDKDRGHDHDQDRDRSNHHEWVADNR